MLVAVKTDTCWKCTSVSREPVKHWYTCTYKTTWCYIWEDRSVPPYDIIICLVHWHSVVLLVFVSRCSSWLRQHRWRDADILRARRCKITSLLFQPRHRMWAAYRHCLQDAKLVLVKRCLNYSGMCVCIRNCNCIYRILRTIRRTFFFEKLPPKFRCVLYSKLI
jgi:hypothetical protein